MSSEVEEPEKLISVALEINDQDYKTAERSRSSVQKSVAVDRIANEDSQAKRNSLDEVNDVKYNRNSTFRSTSSELPIENRDDDVSERSRSSVRKSVAVDRIANENLQAKRHSLDEANGVKFNNIRNHNRNSTFRSTNSDLPIENRNDDDERSRSSVQKSVAVDHIANEDAQAKPNCLDETNGVKLNNIYNHIRNSTFRSTSSDPPIENREHDAGERSRSSVQKSFDVDHIANEDSQVKRDSLDKANGARFNNIRNHNRNSTFRSTSSDLPIGNRVHNAGERSRSSVQKSFDVDYIATEVSQAKRDSLDEANGARFNNIRNHNKNATFRSTSSDPPIENREHDAGERSRSSVQKSFDMDHIANEDSQAKRDSLDEANGVKFNNIRNHIRNSTLRSMSSDPPIEDREHDVGLAEEYHDEMQQLLGISGSNDGKSSESKKSADCADECICKIKQALGLIVEEIKKVDTAIKDLSAKGQCPYVPKPDDKKEFAKSVQKNSSVCHVIIGELKKQRTEIDEMLHLYEESTRDFSKMEATLSRQREKIVQMDVALASVADALSNAREDIARRKENFQLELKSRRSRAETREEILSVFLNWISSLEAKRYEERVVSELRVKEAIEERDRDRAMLTLAVSQLREVRRIEILLITRRAAVTQEREDTSNGPILGTQREMVPHESSCGCSSPIGRVAVVSGQCPPVPRGCGTSRGQPAPVLNYTSTRCAGGADGFGTAMTYSTGLKGNKNGVWNSRTPLGYQNMVLGPRTYQRRVRIGRRKSPTNNSRRHGKKIKNMQKTTAVRHCI